MVQTDRQIETNRQAEKQTDRKTDRQTDSETDRQRQRQRKRERKKERKREREREGETTTTFHKLPLTYTRHKYRQAITILTNRPPRQNAPNKTISRNTALIASFSRAAAGSPGSLAAPPPASIPGLSSGVALLGTLTRGGAAKRRRRKRDRCVGRGRGCKYC